MQPEHKANILLVDDNANNLVTLKAALETLDENFVCASSGEEALKCLLKQDFAVILMDVRMPGMDGFETAAIIRQRDRSKHTPIIFLTGIDKSDSQVSRGYSLGAVDYLFKPIVPEILRAKVTVFVDLYKKTEEIIQRREQEAKAAAIQQRLAFLAEASAMLSASLDYQTTLVNVARLVVPQLADWCTVDIIEEDQVINRLAVAHVDSKKERLMEDLRRRYPPDPRRPEPVLKVLRTGQSELLAEIPDALLVALAQDEEHLKILRMLGMRSHMIVPLQARNRILGAITFVMAESKRSYQPDHLALAEDLAYRAAQAVDNARLYSEAQQANRIKDEFLATVSHELRTPLNAMLGWTRLLSSGKLNEDDCVRALKTIERNARAQAQLVGDLLDISRIITGKLHLNIDEVDITVVVKAAIDAVRPAADAKGITIETELEDWIGLINGDANRLQQVVWNLLSNAIKFSPSAGMVYVTLKRTGRNVEIKVKDNGKGISAEFLPFVFDRFRQADSTSTREHGGLGLGLAIVRHLVEMHGGIVTVESEGEGKGATFTVQLPLAATPLEVVQNDGIDIVSEGGVPLDFQASLEGVRVLIVDDEEDTRDMLEIVVAHSKAEVRAAGTVAEALAILERWWPDVLISDIAMPGEDGYSLIMRVREMEINRGGRIPAVALTAYAKSEDRMRALAAGFQIHVSKPVEPTELINVIANLASMIGKC